MHCVDSDCSDFCVPDDIPELLVPVRNTEDSLSVAGDEVRPGMSPVVPDSWPRFAEARVPPVGTPVHCVDSDCSDFCGADGDPELLGSVRDTVNSLSAGADVFVPGMFPIVLAGTPAVPVCLPAVTGAVLLVVFAGKVAVVVISLADGGTVTDGATIRTETGNKLPTELLESVCGMENGVCVMLM